MCFDSKHPSFTRCLALLTSLGAMSIQDWKPDTIRVRMRTSTVAERKQNLGNTNTIIYGSEASDIMKSASKRMRADVGGEGEASDDQPEHIIIIRWRF